MRSIVWSCCVEVGGHALFIVVNNGKKVRGKAKPLSNKGEGGVRCKG